MNDHEVNYIFFPRATRESRSEMLHPWDAVTVHKSLLDETFQIFGNLKANSTKSLFSFRFTLIKKYFRRGFLSSIHPRQTNECIFRKANCHKLSTTKQSTWPLINYIVDLWQCTKLHKISAIKLKCAFKLKRNRFELYLWV